MNVKTFTIWKSFDSNHKRMTPSFPFNWRTFVDKATANFYCCPWSLLFLFHSFLEPMHFASFCALGNLVITCHLLFWFVSIIWCMMSWVWVWVDLDLSRDHSSITSAKRWLGGVRKWQFLMIYSTIYADVSGWVGLKKPKTCWRNT